MRLINFIFIQIELIIEKIYFYRLYKNENIILGEHVKIDSRAKLEITNGGKIEIGSGTVISKGVIINTWGGEIKIGKNCLIMPYTIIYGNGGVVIGDFVGIAGHSMIVPDNHVITDVSVPILLQGTKGSRIIIENDVWISHGCSILSGVHISQGTVIAAGSVVNRNTSKFDIFAGVPAKRIKNRKNNFENVKNN